MIFVLSDHSELYQPSLVPRLTRANFKKWDFSLDGSLGTRLLPTNDTHKFYASWTLHEPIGIYTGDLYYSLSTGKIMSLLPVLS